MQNKELSLGLVLSLFPSIGQLDKGFEEAGFCVVRGPDLLFGGDIRAFHPPIGVFVGVIGKQAGKFDVLGEYQRIIKEAAPAWWLVENRPHDQNIVVDGYSWQRLDIPRVVDGDQQRNIHHVQFGSVDNVGLQLGHQIAKPAHNVVSDIGNPKTHSAVHAPSDINCKLAELIAESVRDRNEYKMRMCA
jgi:hypothetical protein